MTSTFKVITTTAKIRGSVSWNTSNVQGLPPRYGDINRNIKCPCSQSLCCHATERTINRCTAGCLLTHVTLRYSEISRLMSALNIVHRTSTFKLIKKNKTKLNRIHGIKKIKSNSRDKKHFLLDNTDLKSIAFVQKIGYILNHKTKVIPFCII